MLFYLGTDLLQLVRMRPLVSVAVNGGRYSVVYSATHEPGNQLRSIASQLSKRS
jgi:hypothetical protein